MKNFYVGTISCMVFWLFCLTVAEDLTEADVIQQLLQEDDERLIPESSNFPLSNAEDLKDYVRAIAILKNYLNARGQQSNTKSKRVFCNGLIGCSNGKKRAFPSPSQSLQELPTVPESLNSKPKRLFCNFGGCSNFGKRSLYSTLVDRLRQDNAQDFIDSVSDGNM